MIRKIFSLLFVSLLIFHWFGSEFLFIYCEQQAEKKLLTKLDKQEYREDHLVGIRIAVTHLPYYINSGTYERIDGQVEINGADYYFVKRRIYHDSIEFLCILNPELSRLHGKKIAYMNPANDLQQTGQHENSGTPGTAARSFQSEYEGPVACSCWCGSVLIQRKHSDLFLSGSEIWYPFHPDIPPEPC